MGILDDKVAVITGSTRGLGRAMGELFAREGAAVVVSSRGADAVAETVATLRAEGFQAAGQVCDVGSADQLKALGDYAVAAFGHFDIWINNAAICGPYGPTLDIPLETFERVMQTNMMGTYHGSWVAMKHFLKRGRGKLVNLLGRGYDRPAPYQNAYSSTKAYSGPQKLDHKISKIRWSVKKRVTQ